jgi:hypothetical protein
MSKINIKNITIDATDIKQKEAYEEAAKRAFETVSLEDNFVNLIKVKVADMPAENTHRLLKELGERIYELCGVHNCVLVPLHPRGIQDISIEKIEVVHEGV